MRATLKNGTIIEGTPDQVNHILALAGQTLDPYQYYHSDSKGWTRIADMETTHIRNAMLKMYRDWVTGLSNFNGQNLVLFLRDGPKDKTFAALLTEYINRSK